MKGSFIASIVFTFIFLYACQLNVLFDRSVPPGISSIDQIPSLFQGVYICESDSSVIYADRFIIYQESFYEFTTTLDQVRESEGCSVIDGGIYLPGRKECIPFEYLTEDSITAKVYDIDTLFAFREGEILKSYKGHLFFNYMDNNKNWMTFMITPLSDGALKWELIEVPNVEEKIKDITDQIVAYEEDNSHKRYIINPSLVEFDEIIEKDYTTLCDILNPVKFE